MSRLQKKIVFPPFAIGSFLCGLIVLLTFSQAFPMDRESEEEMMAALVYYLNADCGVLPKKEISEIPQPLDNLLESVASPEATNELEPVLLGLIETKLDSRIRDAITPQLEREWETAQKAQSKNVKREAQRKNAKQAGMQKKNVTSEQLNKKEFINKRLNWLKRIYQLKAVNYFRKAPTKRALPMIEDSDPRLRSALERALQKSKEEKREVLQLAIKSVLDEQ